MSKMANTRLEHRIEEKYGKFFLKEWKRGHIDLNKKELERLMFDSTTEQIDFSFVLKKLINKISKRSRNQKNKDHEKMENSI